MNVGSSCHESFYHVAEEERSGLSDEQIVGEFTYWEGECISTSLVWFAIMD